MFLLAAIWNTGMYLSFAMKAFSFEFEARNDMIILNELKHITCNRSINKYRNNRENVL